MHVDRVATHVFSVIINLEQEGTESDWPLEVVGFDGVRAEVLRWAAACRGERGGARGGGDAPPPPASVVSIFLREASCDGLEETGEQCRPGGPERPIDPAHVT